MGDIPPEVKELYSEFLQGKTKNLLSPRSRKPVGWLEGRRSRYLELADQYRKGSPTVTKNAMGASILSTMAEAVDDALELAVDSGTLSKASSESLREGRELTRLKSELFGQGKVRDVLKTKGRGEPSVLDSDVFDRLWDGRAETTRQIKTALANDKEALKLFKYRVLEDTWKKSKNAKGAFSYNSFNKKFLQENADTLGELFDKSQLDDLQQIADDLRSAESVPDIATRASRGGSQTGQRLSVKNILKSAWQGKYALSRPATSNLIKGFIEKYFSGIKEGVDEVLWEVVMDPEYARQIVSLPDTSLQNVFTKEQFAGFLSESARAGRRLGILSARDFKELESDPDYQFPELAEDEVDIAPVEANTIDSLIESQDPLIQKIISTESSNNPKAVSHAGAHGLMQMTKIAAKDIGADWEKIKTDPEYNVEMGKKFFAKQLKKFNSVPLALASYNMGETALRRLIRQKGTTSWPKLSPHAPKETRNYVAKILGSAKKGETLQFGSE